MPNYLRNYVPGGWYFFTVVTWKRRTFLTSPIARKALHEAFRKVQINWPFDLFAITLMPNHLHCLWKMPDNDYNYSTRWRLIKSEFTHRFFSYGGKEITPSKSMKRKSQRGIWQKRFWEHTVRNETDLKRCLDYIHFNPVKHGLSSNVADYRWSSFKRFVKLEEYPPTWGDVDPCIDWPSAEFAE